MVKEYEQIARTSLCIALFALACNSDTQVTIEETFEPQEGQIAFRGTTSNSALSQAEMKTHRSDLQYVRGLAPAGTAFGINHADPRQHRFAVLRMRLIGKTPENSPQLFKSMADLKVAHEAKGLPIGTVETFATLTEEIVSHHQTMTTATTGGSQALMSGGMASRKDQLSYGLVDNCVWDGAGNLISDCSFEEVFGNMRYSVAQATGDLALAQNSDIQGDSFLSETLSSTGALQQSYVISQPQAITSLTALNVPTVEHPSDMDGNGASVVCLDRTWTGDCEYNNTGFGTLRVPLKGSISVTGTGITIDWPLIRDTYQTTEPAPGRIFVTLGTNGGGCVLPAGGQAMSMRSFWNQVTISPTINPTTINWDLYTDLTKWADFSNACRLVQDTVYVTMDIAVPYVDAITGTKGTLPVTITNAPTPRPLSPPNLQFAPPLRITNSCLAAGTLVATAGGEAHKIDDLQIGDKVLNPYASSLTVIDTSIGTERSLMVHIRDTQGRELLMTEMHPLYVVDRGMVPAKFLKVGDHVKTVDGTSQLVGVTRESYTGQVFNLKVGTTEESRALSVDQTAMYANGFLVGDGQIQDRHEVLEMQAASAGTKRIPMRWRKDYLTSLSRAERAQGQR
jgi:hypothetical protein